MPESLRDVVCLLPGIGGSVLRRDGADVWAISGSSIGQGLLTLGGSVKRLALEGDDPEADNLGDGVTADRLMPDVTILPKLWRIDGYTHMAARLRDHFGLERGVNLIEFPYDWRRDNRASAHRLRRVAETKLKAWREKSGNPDARLILIAHSMGGLVSRYYLEVLGGWRFTRKLVTIGTPFRGSLNALDFLANGYGPSVAGRRLLSLSPLLRSFTSVYQLLPVYPSFDTGTGSLVRLKDFQLIPNVDHQRVESAYAFHKEMEQAVTANLDDPEYRSNGYTLLPVVGTFQPTKQKARLDGKRVLMLYESPDPRLAGDGTVPHGSALPLEFDEADPRWRAVYAAERHSQLQNFDSVLANVIAELGGFDFDRSAFRGAQPLSLDIDDVFAGGEPIPFKVQSDDGLRRFTFDVTNTSTGELINARTINARTAESKTVQLEPLDSGTYRISIRREAVGRPPDTVSEIFLVLPND